MTRKKYRNNLSDDCGKKILEGSGSTSTDMKILGIILQKNDEDRKISRRIMIGSHE